MVCRASARPRNQCRSRHSSRSHQWKLSTEAFCTSLPDSMRRRTHRACGPIDRRPYLPVPSRRSLARRSPFSPCPSRLDSVTPTPAEEGSVAPALPAVARRAASAARWVSTVERAWIRRSKRLGSIPSSLRHVRGDGGGRLLGRRSPSSVGPEPWMQATPTADTRGGCHTL
jgi:hypothetical protein